MLHLEAKWLRNPVKWLLSSTEDKFGNMMTYNYAVDGNEVYIDYIDYAFNLNVSGATTPMYRVKFEYTQTIGNQSDFAKLSLEWSNWDYE